MKIKLLNDGGYHHCKNVKFPAVVEANPIMAGGKVVAYAISSSELTNAGAVIRGVIDGINWHFLAMDCEVIE